MNNRIRFSVISMIIMLLSFQVISGLAQDNNRKKKAWPDSLITETLEGIVIIDSTHENIYFLDVDGDDIADYKLAFGPEWYVPESGATRPADGDHVTIVGALNTKPTIPVVIVFEINGVLWREAIENWWKHQEWCDSLEVVTVTGTVIIDTTYFYHHYYIDLDEDQSPDYSLCFGPPWYEPESGALRPAAGETVTIEGVVKVGDEIDKLIVLKINDLFWRDLYGPPPWTGGWVGKEKQDHKRIYCPIDSLSWIEFPPGAMKGGGKNGPQFPDSIFCEFMQVFRDSLYGRPDSVVAGWHFHFTNPAGKQVHGKGKAVRFIKRLRMQLNCCNDDPGGFSLAKINSGEYSLKYWNEQTGQWLEVEDAIVDLTSNTIQVNPDSIEVYYAIFKTSGNVVRVASNSNNIPDVFSLAQNYPNPFNPTTTISYQTASESLVKLAIYNMLGQEVRTLVNDVKQAGSHKVVWDGRDNNNASLPSGFYIYKITVGNQAQIRRMVMIK